tara:strand:- start:1176 stop:2117 length:942 start_codon:yes stop_codon:yes gene_type:complete
MKSIIVLCGDNTFEDAVKYSNSLGSPTVSYESAQIVSVQSNIQSATEIINNLCEFGYVFMTSIDFELDATSLESALACLYAVALPVDKPITSAEELEKVQEKERFIYVTEPDLSVSVATLQPNGRYESNFFEFDITTGVPKIGKVHVTQDMSVYPVQDIADIDKPQLSLLDPCRIAALRFIDTPHFTSCGKFLLVSETKARTTLSVYVVSMEDVIAMHNDSDYFPLSLEVAVNESNVLDVRVWCDNFHFDFKFHDYVKSRSTVILADALYRHVKNFRPDLVDMHTEGAGNSSYKINQKIHQVLALKHRTVTYA